MQQKLGCCFSLVLGKLRQVRAVILQNSPTPLLAVRPKLSKEGESELLPPAFSCIPGSGPSVSNILHERRRPRCADTWAKTLSGRDTSFRSTQALEPPAQPFSPGCAGSSLCRFVCRGEIGSDGFQMELKRCPYLFKRVPTGAA